jgi:hypothetical protein
MKGKREEKSKMVVINEVVANNIVSVSKVRNGFSASSARRKQEVKAGNAGSEKSSNRSKGSVAEVHKSNEVVGCKSSTAASSQSSTVASSNSSAVVGCLSREISSDIRVVNVGAISDGSKVAVSETSNFHSGILRMEVKEGRATSSRYTCSRADAIFGTVERNKAVEVRIEYSLLGLVSGFLLGEKVQKGISAQGVETVPMILLF